MRTSQPFVGLFAITLGATSCGANIDRGEGGQEGLSRVSQALESASTGAQSLGSSPACVFGSESVTVRNRAQVTADVGSNATVDIQAGDATAKTRVNGNIATRGYVHIGSNSVVGNINTPGAVSVEPGAVTGTVTHNPESTVTLTTKSVTPGSLDINLNAPSCTGANPAPGNYRYINVNPGCTLTLSAGTYNVASLNVNAHAGLNVTGPVNLNASTGFTLGDYAALTGVTDPTTFQVYSNSSVYIQTHTTFRGMILAPNGDAVLGNSSSLTGCIRGKRTALDGVTTGASPDTCNPPLNSVWSSHGNEDSGNLWIVDDAQAFLDGNDRNGNPVAAHFAPATWTKGRFWLPFGSVPDTGDYFYDSTLEPTGIDANANGGVDAAQMLRFHEGHGNPDGFSAIGEFVDMYRMKLGNCSNQGKLRYFWLTSCDVFAHGPQYCGTPLEYGCPQYFDGSPDSGAMRNVYQRWGNAVSDGYLRMACGGSTTMYGGTDHGDTIWYDYSVLHYDVADSFQQGVRLNNPTDAVVPLCITRGGSDVTTTPLYDTTFTNQPNNGGSYYWIQFVNAFQPSSTLAAGSASYESMGALPVLEVAETSVTPPDPSAFVESATAYASKQQIAGRGAQLTIDKASGAQYYQGPITAWSQARSEREYVAMAQTFVQQRNWTEPDAAAPAGSKTLLERATLAGKPEARAQKNVFVSIRRQVTVNGRQIPVIGAGGAITLQMNNDGTIANASKVWRAVKVGASAPLVPFAEAERQARSRVPSTYALQSWDWGYKEEAGDVMQRQMRVVVRFRFVPVMSSLAANATDGLGKIIEVSAQ